MNRKLMTALSAPAVFALLTFGTLAAGTVASASTVTSNVQVDGGGAPSPLYIGDSNQTLSVPLSAVGGTVPGDLTLSADNLPEGVTVTLTGAKQQGNMVTLSVSTQSANAEQTTGVIDALANVSLISGGQTLTVFQVPVQSDPNGQTPRIDAATDN